MHLTGGVCSFPTLSHCLNAGGMGRIDAESETLIPTIGGGFDTVPDVVGTMKSCAQSGGSRVSDEIVAFSSKDYGADASFDIAPTMRAMGHGQSHANAGGQLAVVAFHHNAQAAQLPTNTRDTTVSDSLTCSQGAAAAGSFGVRRLTPIECERLQGFPDGYTLISKAKDGPRYKALGNSMAVPVINWIGRSIRAASWDVWV